MDTAADASEASTVASLEARVAAAAASGDWAGAIRAAEDLELAVHYI
jgi:hypothetical protein